MDDVKEFIKKLPQDNRSNVYHIQTFDLDNNLIDTKYGVNLMTTVGIEDGYIKNNDSKYFVFGTSGTTPTKYDDRLGSRIQDIREVAGKPL